MKHRWSIAAVTLALPALALSQGGGLLAAGTNASPALAQQCSAAALALPGNVSAEIVTPIAPGWTSPPLFSPGAGEPVGVAFCRVAGAIEGDIGFEVWLPDPAAYNGRLLGAGVGGEAGYINYTDMARAVEQGFVATSSDTGHSRGEMWIDDPHKTANYSHRSYHLMTVAAKEIAASFYGEEVDRSYFVGCSGGGRLGMREMQLHPGDYDGMLIGAPGLDVPLLAARFMQVYRAQANPPGTQLSEADWQLVADGAVKSCDANDGLADGVIADPRRCGFRPRELLCRSGQEEGCLTAAKLSAVEGIVQPLTDTRGIEHDHGLLPGITARPGGLPPLPALMFGLANGTYPDWSPEDFDLAADLRAARSRFSAMDASDPDLSDFAERGGRVIFYHGWADASVQPESTIEYVSGLVPVRGELEPDYAQLYMVPGMEHCSGGAGTDAFGGSGDRRPTGDPQSDMLAALIAWVEGGDRPEIIKARRFGAGGRIERTRPLCPWPQEAVWDGKGNPDEAASFQCRRVNGRASIETGEREMASTAALWPVTQIIADGAITPPDVTASPEYVAKTARNRAIMTDFVTLLYEKKQPRLAFERYVDEGYIQHNPNIPDGREEALAWLEPVWDLPEAEIQVRRVLVDGDYAFVQIIGRMNRDDPGSAVMNIFRLEDGIIMEHWDVTQAMPESTASGRPLG